MTGKIVCLGFQKTGTTSLTKALKTLGYDVGAAHTQLNREIDWSSGTLNADICQMVMDTTQNLDAIQDSPCTFLYKDFDTTFPGSKFILTVRDTGNWLESYRNYFPDGNNPLRRWMYGVDRFSGNEAQYRAVFERQNNEIMRYFSNRPEDFLIFDLAKGDGWLELVTFLGKEYLKPFPHANKGR